MEGRSSRRWTRSIARTSVSRAHVVRQEDQTPATERVTSESSQRPPLSRVFVLSSWRRLANVRTPHPCCEDWTADSFMCLAQSDACRVAVYASRNAPFLSTPAAMHRLSELEGHGSISLPSAGDMGCFLKFLRSRTALLFSVVLCPGRPCTARLLQLHWNQKRTVRLF